jgi:hypothetical protein
VKELTLVATELVDYLPIYFVVGANAAGIVLDHGEVGERLVVDDGHGALAAGVKR